MLGDSPKMLGIGVRGAIDKNGPSHLFNSIKKRPGCDVVFGNLETVLSDIGYNSRKFHFAQLRGSASVVSSLCNAGFNVLNVANNHMMQYGIDPFLETCAMLEAHGVAIVGLKGESGWFSRPVFVTKKGVSIGFLGYADPDNYGHPPLFATNNRDNILSDIARLKPNVDVVVVSLHWGREFIRCPSKEQREHASEIIFSGADIILGHHSHVIQQIEFVNKSIVCYCLGNFISDMIWNNRTREGLSVEFNICKNHIKIEKIEKIEINKKFSPNFIDYDINKLNNHISADIEHVASGKNYDKFVNNLIRENCKYSHLYLIKNVFFYNPVVYVQIWFNSFIGFFKKLFRV